MLQKVMNFFSPTSSDNNEIEMQELRQSYLAAYMGGGERDGAHNFFHILFDTQQHAAAFAQKLYDQKIVPKVPNVTVAKDNHPTYPIGAIYLRIHKSEFDGSKTLMPELPANFAQLQTYQSATNNSYR